MALFDEPPVTLKRFLKMLLLYLVVSVPMFILFRPENPGEHYEYLFFLGGLLFFALPYGIKALYERQVKREKLERAQRQQALDS